MITSINHSHKLIHSAKLFFATVLLLLSTPFANAENTYRSDQHNFKLIEITDGLVRPWGLAFLPNGDFLITERVGRLRIVKSGKLDDQAITGLPKNVFVKGQGGVIRCCYPP